MEYKRADVKKYMQKLIDSGIDDIEMAAWQKIFLSANEFTNFIADLEIDECFCKGKDKKCMYCGGCGEMVTSVPSADSVKVARAIREEICHEIEQVLKSRKKTK